MKRVKSWDQVPTDLSCFVHLRLSAIKNILELLHVYLIILLDDKQNVKKHVFPFPQSHCSWSAGSGKSFQSVNKVGAI